MEDVLVLEGKRYISSKRAANEYGYTKDYIGQMARSGKIDARLVGRSWYVLESILQSKRKHKRKIGRDVETPVALSEVDGEVSSDESSLEQEEADTEDSSHESSHIQAVETEEMPTSSELLKFAYQREPTREELARRNRQNALLANTNIRYKDSTPLFYEDDDPLFVAPVKKKTEKAPIPEAIVPSVEPSPSVVDVTITKRVVERPKSPKNIEKNIEKFAPAQQNTIEIVQEDEEIKPSGAFWRYAFASIMLIFAISGTIALSLLEKQSLVTSDGVSNSISTHIDFTKEGPGTNTASVGNQ